MIALLLRFLDEVSYGMIRCVEPGMASMILPDSESKKPCCPSLAPSPLTVMICTPEAHVNDGVLRAKIDISVVISASTSGLMGAATARESRPKSADMEQNFMMGT